MKKDANQIAKIDSVSQLHHLLNLAAPKHPLISMFNLKDIEKFPDTLTKKTNYIFYQICIKKSFDGTMKYGQNYYDFNNGVISFTSPGQILSADINATEGMVLIIHPDFLHGYSLAKTIEEYSFFSYEVHEALFLSEDECTIMEAIMANIDVEYRSNIDVHTQDIIVSQVELLLRYAQRFYSRQFITRKRINHELLSRMEIVLSNYFKEQRPLERGLPSVNYLASQLNVSPHYLSDLLRNITGLNAQQHIQYKIIQNAKKYLSSTDLSVSEIAYQLGFKYSQAFSKAFKKHTSMSPLAYRISYN